MCTGIHHKDHLILLNIAEMREPGSSNLPGSGVCGLVKDIPPLSSGGRRCREIYSHMKIQRLNSTKSIKNGIKRFRLTIFSRII